MVGSPMVLQSYQLQQRTRGVQKTMVPLVVEVYQLLEQGFVQFSKFEVVNYGFLWSVIVV